MSLEQNVPRSDAPKLTLLICTRNRAGRLQPLLATLKNLDCAQPWELIMVDNGSTDTTKTILDNFATHIKSPIKTKIVYEPQKGVSRARNTGLAKSAGDVIAFTDDDCYPTATFLDDILYQFETHEIDYLGGRVTLYDPNDIPTTTKESAEAEEIPPYSFVKAGTIHGANMAILRDVVVDAGGFDERFGPGAPLRSAEDTELIARLSWRGYYGKYDPKPTVAHHQRIQDRTTLKNLYNNYDYGRGAYYLLYTLKTPSRPLYLRAVLRYLYASLARDMAFGRILRELKGAFHLTTLRALKKGGWKGLVPCNRSRRNR